ncbi:MAG: hypothetical protein WC028_28460 [Candidatus Obscuribacterales bacterium]|jgi:hypothetical protein
MSTNPADSKTAVRTEVVLEIEGKGLLSGGVDDFILPPGRGSEYFYEGNLYEVVHAIQTVGDVTSTKGSMLLELLGVLYPDPEHATNLFGGMKYIKKAEIESAPGQIITGSSFGLVLAAQKERLLFLRLRLVHAAVQKKSLVETMQAAHDAAHPKG